MTNTRVKINSIVEGQLPQFVREEFPLVEEFLKQYYISLESNGNANDILQNIDRYIKVDTLTNLVDFTTLTSDVSSFDSTINVTSTSGFPDSYGLILIDSEIITYSSKTNTTFEGCIRGFSGVTSYNSKNDELTFSDSNSSDHLSLTDGQPTQVNNLSILLLKEFLVKVKKQFIPGFESQNLYSDLNEGTFIKQSIDFYSSKGTDTSFKILFLALYGLDVEVIKPRDYLIQPSDAQYRITTELVVEAISGDPEELLNGTLYQDASETKNASQGTITHIEKIRRNNKDYYKVSLDYDYDRNIQVIFGNSFGDFNIVPKTKLVSEAILGSTTLEVDSTVSFPNSGGKLIIDLDNGTSLDITYASKTLNQFLGCSGITQNISEKTEVKEDYYAYGYSQVNQEIITIRVLGVLSSLELENDALLYSKGDPILIKTLGEDLSDYRSNNWFFNIRPEYKVKSIDTLNVSERIYRINLFDDHIIKVGDFVTLKSSLGQNQTAKVISFDDQKSFTLDYGSEDPALNTSLTYSCIRDLSKISTQNYPLIDKYTSNVQNVYYDNNSIYVTSPSIPSYLDTPLDVNDRSVTFSGSFSGEILNIGNHPFYTGDSISYKSLEDNNLGISSGIYFVKRESDTSIRLAKSRSNIFSENFVSVDGFVIDAKFEYSDFTEDNLDTKLLEPQKIIRKISDPVNDTRKYDTLPGTTGIFINGVELLNYKSTDNVYYGPIENISVTSPGSGFDIINPPILTISDSIGFGASVYCSTIGQLERIDIVDPGFDYLEEPIISINGGNGVGAETKANLVSFDHVLSFNSEDSSAINLYPSNTITFQSHHKFRDSEEVIYLTNSQNAISGLSTNSSYFISIQDSFTIKLHRSSKEASEKINAIQFNAYGIGYHSLKSKNKKQKIGSITIANSGVNYQNRLTSTSPVGINTNLDIISIKNHGYNSGEVVVYQPTSSPIGGLTSSKSYYVTSIDSDNFRLSEIGIGSLGITTSFYYDTNQYINLTGVGAGIHRFNYPNISISVKGKVGVSSIFEEECKAILVPIFRGKINSVFVENTGQNYGSEDIINYNRQPTFTINSGSGALLKPTILNGKIVSVNVLSSGLNYNSVPNLEIIGIGTGAILTPVVSNGSLIEVKVIYGGLGYESKNTDIVVIPAGDGAKFNASIKPWKINLVERLINTLQITDDDGILISSRNGYGLQYTHAYPPRKLRSSVQSKNFVNGNAIYVSDLILSDNKEQNSTSHSPIIGWAYDGNPIYGPYGYESSSGGSVKLLKSGYSESLKSNRPSTSKYPIGFFIDDYSYNAIGDLDEHNGRFCITPEYPNGTYAYFSTFGENVESFGNFTNYKKPIFPYIIGNYYKSSPIDFNLDTDSNQDFIDINKTSWKRNTTPYGILSDQTNYNYLLNPNQIRQSNAVVEKISSGSISSIKIISSGKNYKINDKLVFDNKSDFGTNVRAKVSKLIGKKVSNISIASSSFQDVEFLPNNLSLIGFTTIPHNFSNNDLVTISSNYVNKDNKSGNIKINSNSLLLNVGVGTTGQTGIITYFNVSGNLNYPTISENDFYQIGNEVVKILNIDLQSSRIRVIRNIDNSAGLSSYLPGVILNEKSRKFEINFGITTSYNNSVNRQLYFNPSESVGLGTTSGVGIVSTFYFSNPGSGVTQLTIPTQTIYIKNHNLKTGDSLTYSPENGSSLSVSTNGKSSFQLLNKSIVYAAKISNDLIGISTIKIGIGSTGSFVGIGSTSSGILYFTSLGSGTNHSFKTNYDNIFIGEVVKNTVKVSTAETHGLSLLDEVDVDINSGISTEFIIKYDRYNSRLLVNPRSFSSINTGDGSISITNHGYHNGQKVLYTSNTPPPQLSNNRLYYVVVLSSNKIKLSDSFYNATKTIPNTIKITSSSSGTISPINPQIKLIKNQTAIFNLSDPSLSFNVGANIYSAFDFKIYNDINFANEFISTKSSNNFEVVKSGRVGIDTQAKVTLTLNDNVPKTLYYNLIPINTQISTNKIFTDIDVINSNKISIGDSKYSGKYAIYPSSDTEFEYNILEMPEVSSYSNGAEYSTTSKTSFGGIKEILVTNGGRYYSALPGISTVISDFGSECILVPDTTTIGNVLSSNIQDIGFDYSSDHSVRPKAKLPSIITLNAYSTFDYIGITSFGRGYSTTPNLVVLDGLTEKVVEDAELTYSLSDSKVTIVKNTTKLNSIPPKILPTNNSNGFIISSIEYNEISKNVVVTLGSSFSSILDFPFSIGTKVLVEGVNVENDPDAKGYNSSNYEYSLFVINATTPNIGGIGATISYSLSDYLFDGEFPGIFNETTSVARIVPETYFPIFNPVLKKNDFYIGEQVFSNTASGKVESWDFANQYLKISTFEDFKLGDVLKGETSKAQGIIVSILEDNLYYQVNSYTPLRKGWFRETGFLNNDLQRIHDNDYYQYFSYALRSQKDIGIWGSLVSSLNHTAGFKKFSNLLIESSQSNIGISTDQNEGTLSAIATLSETIDLDCVYDFDLASENNIVLNNSLYSNEIIFNSRLIQDYIESIGNRVLIVDDISDKFNSARRSTQYAVVDTFDLDQFRSKKYIILVQDKKNYKNKEVSIIDLIHNNTAGFINQYGTYTTSTLGFFDFSISGTEGNLLYYPKKTRRDNYHIQSFSFTLRDVTSGIGTLTLGDVAKVDTSRVIIPPSTTSPVSIVGIASTYRSGKVLVQIGSSTTPYYEYDELSFVNDGNDIHFIEYGQVTTDTLSLTSTSGIGSYNAYLSGSDTIIELIPFEPIADETIVSTSYIALSNSDFSSTDNEVLGYTSIVSISTSISSSSSPISNEILSYANNARNFSYCVISIEDKTNSNYQMSELLVLSEPDDCSVIEYGVIETNSSLGIITASSSNQQTIVYFTPIPNVEIDVKVFEIRLGLDYLSTEIPLDNGSLKYDYSEYIGTDLDLNTSFELYHKNNPIFKRRFEGNESSIVNIDSNRIKIPNHFFVTGEEIVYSHESIGYGATSGPIGIAETTISGIGLTDKLPKTLYAVKVNDIEMQVASSASDALSPVPIILDLNSVGIGSNHYFTAKNQNKKAVITIDNVIQSPISLTEISYQSQNYMDFFDSEVYLSGIGSISSGDIIKIDNEYMKVYTVGIASTNSISVLRPWLGSGLSTHSSGSQVTKVTGNYNINDNTIHFGQAPYGNIPEITSQSRPDEIDYVGLITHSTFSGRIFTRSGIVGVGTETYFTNYIFDDISSYFNSTKKDFILKSEESNITGISTSNIILLINNVFQGHSNASNANSTGDYLLRENVGITTLTFSGVGRSTDYDVNTSGIPKGGIIVSVSSTFGFGYQPLISAGGTAIVSTSGTIQSISIGNSGSGYRSGIQTYVNVGVTTENINDVNIHIIGTATINNGRVVSVAITNPGTGYTSSNPPKVIFDSPLSYSNIPLVYSSSSPYSGIGSGAKVDIIVGQGSSVISFELKNLGYSYNDGEILTIPIGGSTGIPTQTSLPYSEFQVRIDGIKNDTFSAWAIGSLKKIDSLDNLFDGVKKKFPLSINNERISIIPRKGSNIDIQATLLVFINDILQVPGKGYIFSGGSLITFTEAPKQGDKSKIIFYGGTEDVDTLLVDVLETVKVGDDLTLNSQILDLQENPRRVSNIISPDVAETDLYSGPGISNNPNTLRPVKWCKQREDINVGDLQITKDRLIYEPLVHPSTNIIRNVGVNSTFIFVESVKAFFDSEREYIHDGTNERKQNKIIIISQDSTSTAIGTAIVSTSGTISAISIGNSGSGYTEPPIISVSNPVGIGSTGLAIITSSISGGRVSTLNIISGGSNYSQSNPPAILFESPLTNYEIIDKVEYKGDYGIICGIGTTSIGVGSTAIRFDLFVPTDSILRDTQIVRSGVVTTGISGIQTGDYFVVSKSNVGRGITALNTNGSIVGVGTTFLDNIYQVASVSVAQTSVLGVGLTNVTRVVVRVSGYNGLTGIGLSNYYGDYTWGKILTPFRTNPKSFTTYSQTGGISTSPIIQRFNRLKYFAYDT